MPVYQWSPTGPVKSILPVDNSVEAVPGLKVDSVTDQAQWPDTLHNTRAFRG